MTREDEIFKRIKQGQKDALDELIKLYYPDILKYCRWHLPCQMSAEDAVQETFLKAVRYLNTYTHKGKFKAFLYRVAANVCIDIQRQKLLSPTEDEMEYREAGYEIAESDIDFKKLVKCLPGELEEIVVLRFGQELKIREISEILNLPMRTVQSRLRSALKQVEKRLKEGEGYEQ